MARSKVGGMGAALSAVGFVALTVLTAWSVATDTDAERARSVVWIVLTSLATGGGAVAVFGALRATGGFGTVRARFALGFAVFAVISSLLAWGLFGYGTGLAVAMVLLAQHLREQGLGIAGHRSLWDWAMPVAWLIGPVSQVVNAVTGLFDDSGSIEWVSVIGFSLGTLLAAATMFVMGRWLRSGIPVSAHAVQGATV
jgi:hypothetical protein